MPINLERKEVCSQHSNILLRVPATIIIQEEKKNKAYKIERKKLNCHYSQQLRLYV